MYKPVKLPRNSRYGSNYWADKSFRIKREVTFSSDLEYDHWILIETDPSVVAFCEQPDAPSFILKGDRRTTIFDMWVNRKNGEAHEFIEVKYESELKPGHLNYERSMKQIDVQREWCQQNGHKHIVITDLIIRANPTLLSNKKKIHSLLKHMSSDSYISSLEYFNRIPSQPLRFLDLAQLIPELSVYHLHEFVAYQIYHGNLNANISDVLYGNQMEVWRCQDKS